jgi:hypothetical protein
VGRLGGFHLAYHRDGRTLAIACGPRAVTVSGREASYKWAGRIFRFAVTPPAEARVAFFSGCRRPADVERMKVRR